MIYPLSLGLHSQTDIVAAINDLHARLTAIELKERIREYDPAVSALCGVTLRDRDGELCCLSSEDARAIVAAIRSGAIPGISHGK